MATCDHCGDQLTATPYSCNYCENRLCPDCRLPEKHDCPGLAQTNRGVRRAAIVDVPDASSEDDDATSTSGGSIRNVLAFPLRFPLLVLRGLKKVLSVAANPVVLLTLVMGLLLFAGTVGTGYAPIDERASDALDRVTSFAESDAPEAGADTGTSGTAGATNSGSTDATLNETKIERAIHSRINEIRADRGLSQLQWSSRLHTVADGHSEDMATKGYFSHTAPDGADFSDRYERAGIQCRVSISSTRYVTGSENIAYTYASSDVEAGGGTVNYANNETAIGHGLVRQWMNSQRHREAILKPYWNREGIGIGTAREDGNTRVYATQNFC